MLLVTAIKTSIFALISKSLARFLDVNVPDIESTLFLRDANLRLRNVKIREHKIPIAIQSNNVVCYLILTGTIEELVLFWTWSTFSTPQIIKDATLELSGVKLKVIFRYEKESEESLRAREEPVDYFADEPKEEPDSKPTSRWEKEMRRLTEAMSRIIKDSKYIKQAVNDVRNCFSFQIRDMNVDVHIPFTRNKFELRLNSFLFGSSDNKESAVRPPGPITLGGSIEQLTVYLNFLKITGDERIPVLEPLNLTAKARRTSGTRFLDMLRGYEVIFNGTHYANIPKDSSRGIVVHLTDELKQEVTKFKEAIKGEAASAPDYDGDIYNSQKEPTHTELWPTSLKVLLGLFGLIGVVNATLVLRFILKYTGILSDYHLNIATWIIVFALCAAAAVLLTNFWIKTQRSRFVERLVERELSMQELEEYPAIFRLPFPFITVIAPQNVRITMTDISMVGRIDCSKLHFSSTDFIVNSPRLPPGPRVSSSGLRGIYHKKKLIVNIDLIDDLFIPNRVDLVQPVTNSVVVFEEGRMTVKLKTIKAELLSRDKGTAMRDPRKSVAFKKVQNAAQKTKNRVHFTGRTFFNTGKAATDKVTNMGTRLTQELTNGFKNTKIKFESNVPKSLSRDEKDARNRLQAEVYEGLIKLQRMAAMFELIPVQRHRKNFRFYFETFSGKEAVDFMLENSMAANRIEAVKLLEDFEIEFNLFEGITKEYKFRDKDDFLYRFVPQSKRRFWVRKDLPYDYVETFEREPQSMVLPFPMTICIGGLILFKKKDGEDKEKDGEDKERDGLDSSVLTASKGVICLENGKLSRSINFTVLARGLRSSMIALTNGRIHGIVDPETSKLIHRLQLSLDTLSLNPEYTIEDWLDSLGLIFEGDDDEDDKKSLELRQKDDDEPFELPYAVVSDFLYEVSWEGLFVNAKQNIRKMEGFTGGESTTSGDLIQEFIFKVLGRAPGLLSNMTFMGMNFSRSGGMAFLMDYGAKFVPGVGQYLTIVAMACYDGVEMAIAASKANRNDPNGKYKIGDFTRGIWFAGIDTTRAGAQIRGKNIEDVYDDEDHVKVDPIDFVVGAGDVIKSYADDNKAKYAGAFVSASSMVAMTIAFGPVGGLVAGIVLGIATEQTINFVEKRIRGDKGDENKEEDFDIDDDENE